MDIKACYDPSEESAAKGEMAIDIRRDKPAATLITRIGNEIKSSHHLEEKSYTKLLLELNYAAWMDGIIYGSCEFYMDADDMKFLFERIAEEQEID